MLRSQKPNNIWAHFYLFLKKKEGNDVQMRTFYSFFIADINILRAVFLLISKLSNISINISGFYLDKEGHDHVIYIDLDISDLRIFICLDTFSQQKTRQRAILLQMKLFRFLRCRAALVSGGAAWIAKWGPD